MLIPAQKKSIPYQSQMPPLKAKAMNLNQGNCKFCSPCVLMLWLELTAPTSGTTSLPQQQLLSVGKRYNMDKQKTISHKGSCSYKSEEKEGVVYACSDSFPSSPIFLSWERVREIWRKFKNFSFWDYFALKSLHSKRKITFLLVGRSEN